MNLYYEMLRQPVFNIRDVLKFYDNIETARSALKKLLRDGLAVRIRNEMYTCISGETGSPVANRYQIASAVTPSAYLSHHSAMELYGVADQVFYDVYVSSDTKFSPFRFDGYTYNFLKSACDSGIEDVVYGGGIRVTDKERTVIDCIKDMDAISGTEETLANIAAISGLSEEKLLIYLEHYSNRFLYQKTGFILSLHQERLELSDAFFSECRGRIGKSKRYFTKDEPSGKYDRIWHIIVPENIMTLKNGGTYDFV
ncbi:MAG: hypothetical protein HUJ76_07800 [Parasporobacterium sp.]|nr:hypothetical protein [Parasporobacterium sp.]